MMKKKQGIGMNKNGMRILGVGLLCIGMAVSAQASSDIADTMNYQGVLTRTMTGEVVTNEQDVTIRIYDQAQGGKLLWGETAHIIPKTTDPQPGLFSLVLGNGTPLSGAAYTTLREVFAIGGGQDARYIEFQLDGEASPNAPRQRFLPVPYAFLAGDAAEVASDFYVDGQLTVSSSSLGTATLTAQSDLDIAEYAVMSGDVTFSGHLTITEGANFNGPALLSGTADFAQTAAINGSMTCSSSVSFYQGVTFASLDAVGATNQSVKVGTTYTAATDGFLIIEFKTTDKSNDATGIVNVQVDASVLQMRHYEHYTGNGDMDYYDVATVPVAMGESYMVSIDGDLDGKSTISAEFIPLGK